MTRTPQGLRRRAGGIALLLTVTLLSLPATALAHAELSESDPADGAVVEGTPALISATFTDSLADGSRLRLRDSAGSVVAEGRIDPDDDTRMTIEPPALEPGVYEVRWQALAADGHLERGRYSFTVAPAAVTPAPTDDATPAPSAATTPGPTTAPPATAAPVTPESSAAPGPNGEAAGGTGDILLPILVVMGLVVVGGALLLGRRRTTG